jgi:hypothetical protein
LGRRGRPVFWCGVPFVISRIKKKKEGRKLLKLRGKIAIRRSVEQTRERLASMVDGVTIKTRADLARHLGVSRAYVTQVLGPVVHAVHAVQEHVPHQVESAAAGGGA